MRIYYKILLSGGYSDADILSFAFASERGEKIYIETNDFHEEEVEKGETQYIVDQFLGKKGLKEAVSHIPKMKGAICSLDSGKERLTEFLNKMKFLEFVGRSDYWEIQALIWLLEWSTEDRHINIINIAEATESKYEDLMNKITDVLPQDNALRHALWYKHIALKVHKHGY